MTVQGRDIIFTFDRSCNSRCCLWSKCCTSEIEDEDPVFVTPRGKVRRFDFHAKPGINQNAQRTISNIEKILREKSDDNQKLEAIKIAIQHNLNITLEPLDTHILNASQVRRIEEIAIPIIRNPSPRNEDIEIDDSIPKTPKRIDKP